MIAKKTNPNLETLVNDLKRSSRENSADIWRDIALRLEKPRRNWAEVNLSKLERFTSDGDIVVVAGKVLGAGAISKKITVAAYDFSDSARKSIAEAGGSNLTIMELVKQRPNGSGVKIMR